MSPIENPADIQVGDLVLVKWHQADIFHIVGEIQDNRFLIVNSLGKVNGWVEVSDILGKITQVIEPEPRPSVPVMLEQLRQAYEELAQHEESMDKDSQRLFSIVDDLRWYADRFGADRWDRMPRQNKWSFEQILWRLTKGAKKGYSPEQNHLDRFIDRGKHCVGLASEILLLFEGMETE